MRNLILLLLLSLAVTAHGQSSKHKLSGKFKDGITELVIHADSTFDLTTPDYVFPNTYDAYQNRGVWTSAGKVITLNPQKEKRVPKLLLAEKVIAGLDSIEIKINYFTEVYENEVLISKTVSNFKLLTLSLNKPKNYRNVVHEPIYRYCGFAPQIRKQAVVDSLNVVRFPKQLVEKIGIFTYGFEKTIELATTNPHANSFELTIIQPLDKERMPRHKRVIIKKNSAYFYERNGKLRTFGLLLNALKRVN